MPLPFQPKPLDADAAAFIQRSGATDRTAINAFVRGVKALGLWNNMVCWPLRSSQNAGFGFTVHSLGGLGTFDGTLVNGPTWTANGLTFDATNENVTLPDNANLYNARSGFVCAQLNSTSFAQLLEYQDGLSPAGWYYLFRASDLSVTDNGPRLAAHRSGISINFGNRGLALGDFRTLSFSMDDASDRVHINGAISANGSRTGLSAINGTGARNIRVAFGNSTNMTGAFAFLSPVTLTNTQILALHSLYKSTLGTGLGLP